MPNYNQLLLGKADDFTTAHLNYAVYTKPSGTFDATETSMYSEVIGLASTTLFGGASLGNQTERYLIAMTDFRSDTNAYNPYIASRIPSSAVSFEGLFSGEFASYSPINSTTFSGIQTDLEDDGKHFFASTYSGNTETQFLLIVDKNNLGSSGGSSGSSSSAANSLMSWAYSSQTSSDPDQIMGWNAVTPTIAQVGTPLDWRTELRNKITSSSHDIENLIFDYLVDEEMKSNYTFHEYLAKKGI